MENGHIFLDAYKFRLGYTQAMQAQVRLLVEEISDQGIFIPPVYEVYRGYIVFAFSVCLFVCKLFFPSKISQELLDLRS